MSSKLTDLLPATAVPYPPSFRLAAQASLSALYLSYSRADAPIQQSEAPSVSLGDLHGLVDVKLLRALALLLGRHHALGGLVLILARQRLEVFNLRLI